jgi:hypothetical protein
MPLRSQTVAQPRYEPLDIGIEGFAWQDADPADPHPPWNLVLAADTAHPVFDVDFGTTELTFWITGMTYEEVAGFLTHYRGGTIQVYVDERKDHHYALHPPNATVPGSFINGELFLEADIMSFFVLRFPNQVVLYTAYLDNLRGPAVQRLQPYYGWRHELTLMSYRSYVPIDVPDGYECGVAGQLKWETLTPVESTTFSSVKALFR